MGVPASVGRRIDGRAEISTYCSYCFGLWLSDDEESYSVDGVSRWELCVLGLWSEDQNWREERVWELYEEKSPLGTFESSVAGGPGPRHNQRITRHTLAGLLSFACAVPGAL